MGNDYIYVGWPDSQKYMDYEGFEEYAQATDESGEYLIEKEWKKAVDRGEIPELD